MLPAAPAVNPVSTPPPLVHTTLPGTNETHLPPTTVSPPFSSPQVDGNARGNSGTPRPQASSPPSSPALMPAAFPSVGVPPGPAETFTLGAQTNFLAQLIGQEITPSVRQVLVQYEKMVHISQVKYKPSEAMKPEAEPAGLFGKWLESQAAESPAASRAAARAAAQAVSAPALAAAAAESAAVLSGTPQLTELPQAARAPKLSFAQEIAQEIAEEERAAGDAMHGRPPAAHPHSRRIGAYQAAAGRVHMSGLQDPPADDPVREVA